MVWGGSSTAPFTAVGPSGESAGSLTLILFESGTGALTLSGGSLGGAAFNGSAIVTTTSVAYTGQDQDGDTVILHLVVSGTTIVAGSLAITGES
jgi:hypothetical protein